MDDKEAVAGYTLHAAPPTTPQCEPHEPQPDGYGTRSEWAELMMVTHDCRACKGCGLYMIWEPKEKADA